MAWENQYMSADVDKNSLMIGEAEKLGKAVQQALSPPPLSYQLVGTGI